MSDTNRTIVVAIDDSDLAPVILERAVALGRVWPYGIPILAGACSLLVLMTSSVQLAALLAAAASLLLLAVFIQLYREYPSEHFVIMGLSAAVCSRAVVAWLPGLDDRRGKAGTVQDYTPSRNGPDSISFRRRGAHGGPDNLLDGFYVGGSWRRDWLVHGCRLVAALRHGLAEPAARGFLAFHGTVPDRRVPVAGGGKRRVDFSCAFVQRGAFL